MRHAIHIVVPGEPIGRGRARSTVRGGRHYTPAKTRAEDTGIRLLAARAMEGQPPLTGPVLVWIWAYRSVPKSWPEKKRTAALAGMIFPTQKPDFDNCAKMVDAITGIVWLDDAQVCDAHIFKRFSAEPRLVIRAIQMEPR